MARPHAPDDRFSQAQLRYFERADAARFAWTTEGAGFAETEAALLRELPSPLESPWLELGCGEGNNLLLLEGPALRFGVDFSVPKLAFAARHVADACFTASDAVLLPFRDSSFRTVFVRDLLHHVPAPPDVIREAVRVLAPGGCLCILEPNPRNPLVRMQSHLIAAEAGIRRGGRDRLRQWLAGLPLRDVELRPLQPLPLRRLLLHYRFGVPRLGRLAAVRRLLEVAERGIGRLLPERRWAYLLATAQRTQDGAEAEQS